MMIKRMLVKNAIKNIPSVERECDCEEKCDSCTCKKKSLPKRKKQQEIDKHA